MVLLDLPNELLQAIADCLELERDVNAFALTNRHLHSLLDRYLYRRNVRVFGSSALLWAAEKGRVATAQKSLDAGATVPSKSGGRINVGIPLSKAAGCGHEAVVQLLIGREDADINYKDSLGLTALSVAAINGRETVVKLLVSEANIDINLTDCDGMTALGHAIAHDQLECVRLLLSCRDIDVNLGYPLTRFSNDYFGWYDGTFHPGHKNQIAALLLSRPDFDVNFLHSSGEAAWQSVAKNLNFPTLQLLLAREDFDPSLTESHCTSNIADICHYMHNSDIMTAEGLLNVVLILRALDQDSRFAMDDFYMLRFSHHVVYYAFSDAGTQKNGYYEIDSFIIFDHSPEFREKLRGLLESHGCTLSMRDSKERTYLHCAAYWGLEDFALYLIEQGAEINSRDTTGSTPLHAAVSEGQTALVELLLNQGADVSARDNDGTSLVQVAANLKTAVPIITTLLDGGATIDTVDLFGNTPLHSAVWGANLETCEFLLELGADPNKCSTVGTPLHAASHLMDDKLILLILSGTAETTSPPDPNVLDCYGRSTFDHIASFGPLSEKLSSRMVSYKPTPPEVTNYHLLQRLRERIDRIIREPHNRSYLTFRLGKQLLFLGDDKSARVAFEVDFHMDEKPGAEPTVRHDEYFCDTCPRTTGLFYFCKCCPFGDFCAKCVNDRPEDKDPWCRDHNYLEVPGPGWRDRPQGVVNDEGQTFDEWIKDLQMKYSSDQV